MESSKTMRLADQARRDLEELDEHAPTTVCIKVVANDAPNGDGVWRKVVVDDRSKLRERNGMWDMLSELAGPGNHAVSMTTDLRYDGKPGGWQSNHRS